MSLSQSNPLHHLLHRCRLIRWYACTTLFNLLCWTWKRFHKHTTESRFKSPKISFNEAGVATSPPSIEIFLHGGPPSRSRQETYTICTLGPLRESSQSAKIPKGHIRRNPPLVFFRMQVYWIYSFSRNNAHAIANYRKALWSWMHHEEGIPHLTLGQLNPQLGLIKEQRRGASLPRWKRADGIGSTAPQRHKHQRAIPLLPLTLCWWLW